MIKAREALNKEINIVSIVRQLRFFKLAYHELLPKEARKKLKKQSRYVLIDPDSDDTL